MDDSTKNINSIPDIHRFPAKTHTKYRLNKVQQLRTDATMASLVQSYTEKTITNVTLTKYEKLDALKEAYFKALESYNESYNEESFMKLRGAEDAYMLCLSSDDSLAFDC